jgi:hypothetical protein
MEERMKRHSLTSRLCALAVGGILMGAAVISLAETGRRPAPLTPDPGSHFVVPSDRYSASPDSRDLHTLVEELESSSPSDIDTGRIGRYFTNPAVIITDGRAHQINWDRIQQDTRTDRSRGDRNENDADVPDRSNGNARSQDVQIQDFETHRIDAHTAVVIYTAVLPDDGGGVFHQPVCATVVRESSGGPWRVASYTAEEAAIPGGSDLNQGDQLPDGQGTPLPSQER